MLATDTNGFNLEKLLRYRPLPFKILTRGFIERTGVYIYRDFPFLKIFGTSAELHFILKSVILIDRDLFKLNI